MLRTVEESRGYDFQDPENAEKWRGLFINSLRKVLEQVHPGLGAEGAALSYVEALLWRLLGMLCAPPSPLTLQDVEERVAASFPTPIHRWALADAREVAARARRSRPPHLPTLPADKLHQLLQKEVLLYKIDMSVSIFITAILEYISVDILKLAGNFVKKISQKSGYDQITCRDIKTAMYADKVLMDMFYQEDEASAPAGGARRGSLTYAELVRDLLTDEKSFLRDLHLIIRVFKDELEKILDKEPKTIELIFGNIVDIYELTVTLLGNLEDAMEMSQDSPTPYIGSCFEELAEVEEFRAYVRYANKVTRPESRDTLQNIVDDPNVSERLETAGHGFRLAVKYYLPKLVLAPVAHMFLYHHYVLALLQIAPASEDRESFKQVECNLQPITKSLMMALGNGPKMEAAAAAAALRAATRARRQLAIDKCNELARLVDHWDARDVAQCCNEFVREDTLSKIGPGRRVAERRAYLFDGLLLLCKPSAGLAGSMGGGGGSGAASASGVGQLKLKEKLHIRKLDVVDRADTDELKHLVELVPRCGPGVLLACGSAAEKRNWMSDLVMLNTKPMLDRTLDSILLDLERRHPLKLPPEHLYRFAVPDSKDNILLEERPGHPPLIKGATLLKLVERLTYHIYADLVLVRTFLTTYRSFCAPAELLELLVERFNIPDPSLVYDAPAAAAPGDTIESTVSSDAEKLSKNTVREDWKRYRKEFQQPVKFRVINVLRHWVDQHFYDFERDPALLEKLRQFLESVDGKPMKKWVQSVLKTVQRKSAAAAAPPEAEDGVAHVFDRAPPAPRRHAHEPPELHAWHPLALHPLELARQLTLLEFHLYRMVKPSELVGAVWTKKEKEITSPNLLKIIKHTTNFTRWMEKWIVESSNVEERAAVVARLVEVALALDELNNFNGVLAVLAAAGSAAVHRLKATYQLLPLRLTRALEQLRALSADHFRRYQERLRSINPPCVPFLGIYLTNILHIEEGNLDVLPDSKLINFSKRRMVAEITGEIQQYQNQPYCLTVEPKTRAFLETLDPFPGMDDNEITNYLYSKSLEIEPRNNNKQMLKFPRKYPELSLKPIKSRRHQDHHNHTNDDNVSVCQLSPPGGGAWDSASASASQLSLHQDEHRGSKQEDRLCLVSPRLERSSTNAFSLFDKGFGLFDKRIASTVSLNRHGSGATGVGSAATSPCGRDGLSGSVADLPHADAHARSNSVSGASISLTGSAGSTGRVALSPRSAIVDADTFYPHRHHHDTERVPPLLPRNSITGVGAPEPDAAEPPELPPRTDATAWSISPHHTPQPHPHQIQQLSDSTFRPTCAGAAMSPKRSPAPAPPQAQDRNSFAFNFPPRAAPTPSPVAPAPSLNTPRAAESPPAAPAPATPPPATPPPLPPRRRRDSAQHAPPPPPPHTPSNAPALAQPLSRSPAARSPPPLPPRPPPAPELLRPRDSAILQRRHHSAPRLPPKPPPPAVAPRT